MTSTYKYFCKFVLTCLFTAVALNATTDERVRAKCTDRDALIERLSRLEQRLAQLDHLSQPQPAASEEPAGESCEAMLQNWMEDLDRRMAAIEKAPATTGPTSLRLFRRILHGSSMECESSGSPPTS